MALERNPEVCAKQLKKLEIMKLPAHGWRWIDYQNCKKICNEKKDMKLSY